MKITSLYQLDIGDFPIAWTYDLTPSTLAEFTEFPQSQLEGFFGAPSSSVGILNIYYEEDMSWSDVAECMDGSAEAIIPLQWTNKWRVDAKIDEADKVIDKIINAMNELKSNHYWRDWDFRDENGVPFKTLDRYARLHGYILYTHNLMGTDRGDDLDVLHIIPIERDEKQTVLYQEVMPYWAGNRFAIQVILNSPFTDRPAFNETLGWIVGRDQYVLDTAVEIINDAIVDITTRKDR